MASWQEAVRQAYKKSGTESKAAAMSTVLRAERGEGAYGTRPSSGSSSSSSSSRSSSSSSSSSSRPFNAGEFVAATKPDIGQGAPDYSTDAGRAAGAANDARLASDPAFVRSEIERARSVIAARQSQGLPTTDQQAYLSRLLSMTSGGSSASAPQAVERVASPSPPPPPQTNFAPSLTPEQVRAMGAQGFNEFRARYGLQPVDLSVYSSAAQGGFIDERRVSQNAQGQVLVDNQPYTIPADAPYSGGGDVRRGPTGLPGEDPVTVVSRVNPSALGSAITTLGLPSLSDIAGLLAGGTTQPIESVLGPINLPANTALPSVPDLATFRPTPSAITPENLKGLVDTLTGLLQPQIDALEASGQERLAERLRQRREQLAAMGQSLSTTAVSDEDALTRQLNQDIAAQRADIIGRVVNQLPAFVGLGLQERGQQFEEFRDTNRLNLDLAQLRRDLGNDAFRRLMDIAGLTGTIPTGLPGAGASTLAARQLDEQRRANNIRAAVDLSQAFGVPVFPKDSGQALFEQIGGMQTVGLREALQRIVQQGRGPVLTPRQQIEAKLLRGETLTADERALLGLDRSAGKDADKAQEEEEAVEVADLHKWINDRKRTGYDADWQIKTAAIGMAQDAFQKGRISARTYLRLVQEIEKALPADQVEYPAPPQ